MSLSRSDAIEILSVLASQLTWAYGVNTLPEYDKVARRLANSALCRARRSIARS
jgi:hypothetical protein